MLHHSNALLDSQAFVKISDHALLDSLGDSKLVEIECQNRHERLLCTCHSMKTIRNVLRHGSETTDSECYGEQDAHHFVDRDSAFVENSLE